MPSLERRRQQLRTLYGFDFPDDLFRFWEFACRVRPLEPLHALDALGLNLVGPFEALAGRFDGRSPRHSMLLHWRYHDDPPEFFTVLAGGPDGLHWGYFLDDPADPRGCLASYFLHGAYELSSEGDTLFEAVRLYLEQHHRDGVELGPRSGSQAHALTQIGKIRESVLQFATRDRPETGADYEEAYPPRAQRDDRVVAATLEGMGVVAPGDTYRPLSLKDRALWSYLRKTRDPAEVVREARAALRADYPTTALKLGKDLWATGGEVRTVYAFELLAAAYDALGRPALGAVLAAHCSHRDLSSVDILEMEEGS